MANPDADTEGELFLSESTRIAIWEGKLKTLRKRFKRQVHECVQATNRMLRMHILIWKFGGSMPKLSMLDRDGKRYTVQNPEPFYTLLNFIDALGFEQKNCEFKRTSTRKLIVIKNFIITKNNSLVMKLIGRNHVTKLVHRKLRAATYNMSRNTLCDFPDYTNITDDHVRIEEIIRRIRVRRTDLDPEQIDSAEEQLTENLSRHWYRWAVNKFGRWVLKNFGISRWPSWDQDEPYGEAWF